MGQFTPADLEIVERLVKRLAGTTDDFDMVAEEELEVRTTPEICAYFDKKLWRCEDCGHWTQTQEIEKHNGFCIGCAK